MTKRYLKPARQEKQIIILTLKTDQPEAEIGLYDGAMQVGYLKWQAHRQLSATLPAKLSEILNKSSISYDRLGGLVVFKGPGSFTGLRIGASAANAVAYSLNLPIVAAAGQDWIKTGVEKLQAGQNEQIALPEYGAPAKTTTQKK